MEISWKECFHKLSSSPTGA